VAAISAAGLRAERFLFVGFLPSSAKARRDLLAQHAAADFALVMYEAPHRVLQSVAAMREAVGESRELIVAREISKKFEMIARVTLGGAADWFVADPNRERGEFVLILDASQRPRESASVLDSQADRLLRALLAELPPSRAARLVANLTGVPRDDVYRHALAVNAEGE
jgi:16S rRNA (cytidine1402-2'-O)-methyltransferase